MCLIVLRWTPNAQRGARLLVAANRDEFFHRPASPLQRWPQHQDIFAGMDHGAPLARSGVPGTWMGLHRDGRFAALTNVRSPRERHPSAASRGHLVSNYLAGDRPPAEYLLEVQASADRYNGFNLLIGSTRAEEAQLWWYSNRAGGAPRKLAAGVYGLSNAALDTPWPKVVRAVSRFSMLAAAGVTSDALFELLADPTPATDETLPKTGVPLEWERTLSPIFIATPQYGTRASQVLSVSADGHIDYRERNFDQGSVHRPTEITLHAQTVT